MKVAVSCKSIININYQLVKSSRKTLSVEVRDGCVVVRTPHYLPRFIIERFLSEKETWILAKVEASRKTDQVLFLGEPIEFIYSGTPNQDQKLLSILGSSDLEKARARDKFYKQETIFYVTKYLSVHKESFLFKNVNYRKFKSKWGSCSGQNELSFNTLLSMCPEYVIEYVVVHELCHTRIKNHSKSFYDEVGKYLPDYKIRRRWLRQNRGLI